ncbi:CPBP family intramembrane glutamic endopeptidase [Fructilactobacillus vespulae]|uniref:CPBP family intramembrane glutamic endopeptidase n=1 Tax=Fructilactobacillus vespulae TaxID=1249630 RepID=UPI0039B47067
MNKKLAPYLLIIMTAIGTIGWSFVSDVPGGMISKLTTPMIQGFPHVEWVSFLIELFTDLILIVAMYFAYRKRKEIWDFANQRIFKELGLGWLLGFGFFALIWLISVFMGGFKVTGIFNILNIGWFLLFVVGYFIQGLSEEVLFRGYVMGRFVEYRHIFLGIFFNSLFFTILHGANDNFTTEAFLGLFLFGLLMSFLRYAGMSLWGLGAFHGAWNLTEGVIFGTSVSGNEATSIIFSSKMIPGHALINGNEFGIEASWLSIIMHVIFIGLILVWMKKFKKNSI